MALPDVFAQYAAMEGAVIPEGMLDALMADAAESEAAFSSQIEGLTNELSGRDNDLNAAQARISDLMTAAAAIPGIDPDAGDSFDDPDDPDLDADPGDDEDADMDDLFSDSPDDDDK